MHSLHVHTLGGDVDYVCSLFTREYGAIIETNIQDCTYIERRINIYEK